MNKIIAFKIHTNITINSLDETIAEVNIPNSHTPNYSRIALFTGSFDPITFNHLTIGFETINCALASHFMFLPTSNIIRKPLATPFSTRLNSIHSLMNQLSANFSVSAAKNTRNNQQMFEAIHSNYPNSQLVYPTHMSGKTAPKVLQAISLGMEPEEAVKTIISPLCSSLIIIGHNDLSLPKNTPQLIDNNFIVPLKLPSKYNHLQWLHSTLLRENKVTQNIFIENKGTHIQLQALIKIINNQI